jgi:serine/threonine-protein kinase HipA
LKLDPKQLENIFKKMERAKEKWMEFIVIGFISDEFKGVYKALLEKDF